MNREIRFGHRKVGPGRPCFIIAEAGINHNGSLTRALRLVATAARAGADAVKFQSFSADRLASPSAPKASYQTLGAPALEKQNGMLRRLELSVDAHRQLRRECRRRRILFLSSPFDEQSADLLAHIGISAFKIPSGELTNLPLISRIASWDRPILLSTGMGTLTEIGRAVRAIYRTGNRRLILLHCVSAYPTAPKDANLRALETLRRTFRVPVGYSDHTVGLPVAWAAIAQGACVLEKHFTLDRSLPGPDHFFSLEPRELAELVRGVRAVEAALGDGRKHPCRAEARIARVVRKSLAAARAIAPGERISREDIVLLRPGTGLPPDALPLLIGRRARRPIGRGALIQHGWFR